MKTWLLNHWDRLRNSLWFVPAVGLVSALMTAELLLEADRVLRTETMPGMAWVNTTAAAARATLSTLAGALVTVTGVVFSVTMLTLAQTSSMFGSRILRSFLDHNLAQFTLAAFLGTSAYCFAVLRSIEETDGGAVFVPHLSVFVSLLFGLLSLITFIYFIHHVSRSVQAQTVVRNLAEELESAIDRLFPETLSDPCAAAADEQDAVDENSFHGLQDASSTLLIEAHENGYVQAVNREALLRIATTHDLLIRLRRRPGHFVAAGTPIAEVLSEKSVDAEPLGALISECFLTGSRRTPRQDVECTIQELVEVAVRALSPGINDPRTAIACIDYLSAALMKLCRRRMPETLLRDEAGRVRVISERIEFGNALDAAFDEIRQYGRETASVTIRLADSLLSIARKLVRMSDRDAVLRQAAMLQRGTDALPEKYDRADVRGRLQELHKLLDSRPDSCEESGIDRHDDA